MSGKKQTESDQHGLTLFKMLRKLTGWFLTGFCLAVIVFLAIESAIIVVEKVRAPVESHGESADKDMSQFWTQGRAHRDPVPYLIFYPQANLDVQDRYFGRQRSHLVTNNFGFRYSQDITKNKAANIYRIFMLGGSVVFNGKSNETTISGMLEKKLNTERIDDTIYQCVNAGASSFISDQELALLVHRIIDLKPDLIIVFDGFNDLWFPYYYEPRVGYPINWSAYENAFRNNNQIRSVLQSIGFFKGIMSTSRLFTRFRPDLTLENRITQAFYEGTTAEHPTPEVSAIVSHLATNWNKMYHFAQSNQVELICFLQPGNPQIREKPFVDQFYSAMNGFIDKARSEQSMPFYSFDKLLDDKPDLFVPGDPVHTWDAGHEIYVREMIKIIRNGKEHHF